MRWGLAAVCTGLLSVSLLIACGGASPGSSGAPEPVFVKVPPSQVETRITGGSTAQRDLLREILAGVGGTIPRAAIVQPESYWHPHKGDVAIQLEGGEHTLPRQHLVAGAFVDRSEQAGLPNVVAAEVTGDGFPVGRDPGVTSVPNERPVVVGEEEAVRLNDALADAASAAGARLRSLRILEPWGTAAEVTLEVDDPAPFLARRYHEFKRRSRSVWGAFSEGWSLEVVDGAGGLVLHDSQAARVFSTSSFVREDLEGCVSLGMSRPSTWSPPPCPARR